MAWGDRKAVARMLLNDVVAANTGQRVPWFVSPFLFRSDFGKMLLANALAGPTELAALEGHLWRETDLMKLTVPVYPMVGGTSPPFNRRFADFVAAHVPDTRVHVVESGNHGTPIDDSATFAALLTRLR